MNIVPQDTKEKPMIVEMLYQTETILFGLYSQSQSLDHRPEGKRLWQKCTDLSLAVLEGLHEIFALRNQEIRYGMYLEENRDLHWFTNKFHRRVLKISQLFTTWSYLKKTAVILYSLELKRLNLMKKIEKDDSVDEENYLKIDAMLEERSRLLQRIIDLYKEEEKTCRSLDPLIFESAYMS